MVIIFPLFIAFQINYIFAFKWRVQEILEFFQTNALNEEKTLQLIDK